MPQWMHASEFCISRPGMPLLRLRKPASHAEISELSLVASHAPHAESKTLKDSSRTRGLPVSVQTVFYTTSRRTPPRQGGRPG